MGKRKYVAATMGEALLQMHESDSDGIETSQPSRTSTSRPREVTPSLVLQPQRSQLSLVPAIVLESRDSGPCSRRHGRGRGRAKGIKEWGTGAKLNVEFNDKFQPLNKLGRSFKGQLGQIVRNPQRVPLTYLSWGSVPEDTVEGIWKEVQDNLLYAPEGLKPVVIDSCNKLWKDHKNKTKTNHYTSLKDDPNISEKVPLDILPEQWRVLVEYWSSKDAMKIANRNSKNRELRGPTHRTGRTPFADVRHKMMADGESTNKMSVFMKTRMITDPDVKLFLDEYNEQLSRIDEPFRTEEVQDKIFHNLVGKDGHGYCKTYGVGVPRSEVYKKDISPSQASSSSTVEEITQQVRQAVTQEIMQRLTVEIEQRLTVEIEQRVTEKLKLDFEQIRAWMDFIGSQGGPSGIQLPNASSGRRHVRKSVGDDDSDDDELLGSPVQVLHED